MTSTRDGIRSAVVGAGFIGPQHVDAIRRCGHADVAWLVGRDADRTRAMARELGVPGSTTDLDHVLADRDVDVVHVCTPNDTHVAIGIAALEAGKHLVMEKPIAVDRAGAAALLSAAERAGRHAAVSLTYRGYPMVREARDLVRAGRIGELRLAHGVYLQDWLAAASDYNWRLESTAGGASRAFADIGTHWFDTVEFITGTRADAVFADLATFVPVRDRPARSATAFSAGGGETEAVPVDTEDAATVLVRFAGGARGSLVVSQVSPGRKNGLVLELAGSERSMGWEQEDPEHLWLRGRDESTLLQRGPRSGARSNALGALPAGHPEGWAEALRDVLRPFYAAVVAGSAPAALDAPYPTLRDGARGIALVEAVIESSRVGSWTPVLEISGNAMEVAG